MDAETIIDLFVEFGPVQVRRMFGGAGIYRDGMMFGLVAGGQIHLKTDAVSIVLFEGEGCGPFQYDTKDGKRTITSYWRIPDRLYDDPTELAEWARRAFAVARGKAATKSVSRKKKKL